MLVYELPSEQFNKITPLIGDVLIDRALIEAVIEGTTVGRIFVDRVDQPTAALVAPGSRDYFILGSIGSANLRRFLRDLPEEAEIFNAPHFAFFLPDPIWKDVLRADSREPITFYDSRCFRYDHSSIKPLESWRTEDNKNAAIRPIDAGFMADVKARTVQPDEEEREFSTEQLTYIAGNRLGYAAVVDGHIASVAYAFSLSSKHANLFIDTHPDDRQRGLATLVAGAFIEACLKRGLTPIWNGLASNEASIKLAQKLGFSEGPRQIETKWPPYNNGKIPRTSGEWTQETRPDGVIVWKVPKED